LHRNSFRAYHLATRGWTRDRHWDWEGTGAGVDRRRVDHVDGGVLRHDRRDIDRAVTRRRTNVAVRRKAPFLSGGGGARCVVVVVTEAEEPAARRQRGGGHEEKRAVGEHA
jgi:hypothetical protein